MRCTTKPGRYFFPGSVMDARREIASMNVKIRNHDTTIMLCLKECKFLGKSLALYPIRAGKRRQTTVFCWIRESNQNRGLTQSAARVLSSSAQRKIYRSIEELQIDLDDWLHYYNHDRTHQGKMCCGRIPIQTLIDAKEVWHDKITSRLNLI